MDFPPTQDPDTIIRALATAEFNQEVEDARDQLSREVSSEKWKARKQDAYHPSVTSAPTVDIARHFLGRANVCVALEYLGGSGPQLLQSPLQRDVTQAQVQKLVNLAGKNASTLFREDPQHELIITIDPDLIDLSTLSNEMTGPFSFAKFVPGAIDHRCYLEHGKARILAIKELFKAGLKEHTRLQQAIALDGEETGTLRGLLKALNKKLRSGGFWLVAFYNRTTIEAETAARQAILLKLSTNSIHKGAPETPVHHFRQIVHSLAQAASNEDREQVIALASTLEPDRRSDVRQLLTKYPDVVAIFTYLFMFRPFYTYGFQPRRLVKAKKTIWGGIRLIQFLASPLDIPLKRGEVLNKKTAPQLRPILMSRMRENMRSIRGMYDHRVGALVISVARYQHRLHLTPAMEYFGAGFKEWANRTRDYYKGIKESIRTRVDYELESGRRWTDDQKAMLRKLTHKLDTVIDFSLICGPGLGPELDSNPPLLTPEFVDELLDLCMTIEPTVSMMCSWFVPNLKDYHSQRTAPKATIADEIPIFKSDFELFVDYLKYFMCFGEPEWATTPVGTVLASKYEGEEDTCDMLVQRLVNQIIALIFRERHKALIPFIASTQAMLSKRANSWITPDKKRSLEEDVPRFLVALNEWAKARQAVPDDPPLLLVRHTEPLPTEVVLEFLGTANNVWNKVVAGFVASTYIWTVNKRNILVVRKRFTANLLQEAIHYAYSHRNFVNDNPPLKNFRKKLLSLIQGTLGLEDAPVWCRFTEVRTEPETPADDDDPESSEIEDNIVRDNQLLRQCAESDDLHNRAYTTFLKALSKPGVLGVPTGDKKIKWAVHPHAAKPLKELRKITNALQAECKAIHTKDKSQVLQHGQPIDTSLDGEDAKIAWNFATARQVAAYYASLEENSSDEAEEDNGGINYDDDNFRQRPDHHDADEGHRNSIRMSENQDRQCERDSEDSEEEGEDDEREGDGGDEDEAHEDQAEDEESEDEQGGHGFIDMEAGEDSQEDEEEDSIKLDSDDEEEHGSSRQASDVDEDEVKGTELPTPPASFYPNSSQASPSPQNLSRPTRASPSSDIQDDFDSVSSPSLSAIGGTQPGHVSRGKRTLIGEDEGRAEKRRKKVAEEEDIDYWSQLEELPLDD